MANLCIKTPSSASLVLIFQLLVLRPRPIAHILSKYFSKKLDLIITCLLSFLRNWASRTPGRLDVWGWGWGWGGGGLQSCQVSDPQVGLLPGHHASRLVLAPDKHPEVWLITQEPCPCSFFPVSEPVLRNVKLSTSGGVWLVLFPCLYPLSLFHIRCRAKCECQNIRGLTPDPGFQPFLSDCHPVLRNL